MIFYFDFKQYFRMLRMSFQEENPQGRRQLYFMLLLVIPLMSSFTAICFFLDGLLFPRLWRVQVKEPVFIVGHARSGTTLMHRIMARDGERFSAFMLYELFFPSLIQKKLIRLLATCDRNWLGGRIEKRMQAWEKEKFGKTQDIHRMGLTLFEEDDFIFTLSCASGYWIVLLPYMDKLDFYHVDQRPPASRQRMMRFYGECVRRQLYLNGPDKIHLSKNPTFCGRVGTITEVFPDARIVYMARNPEETIPSLLKLMKTGWSMRGWNEQDMFRSLRILAEQSYETYTAPLEVIANHKEIRSAIVDYRELVDDTRNTVQKVYAELELPISAEFQKILGEEGARSGRHETTHRYSLEEFGLSKDEIHSELEDLFERFQWPRGPN